ncbi:MAG: hypothetical protein K6T99_12815, partial [Armatimonadetes bacterium]|nr:hypothetical protein [Armatimonadota bacterium]
MKRQRRSLQRFHIRGIKNPNAVITRKASTARSKPICLLRLNGQYTQTAYTIMPHNKPMKIPLIMRICC